MFDISKKKHKV